MTGFRMFVLALVMTALTATPALAHGGGGGGGGGAGGRRYSFPPGRVSAC
jgi:hypothetical protein